jgi:hypothetical protein
MDSLIGLIGYFARVRIERMVVMWEVVRTALKIIFRAGSSAF